jgi:hypothetical protein
MAESRKSCSPFIAYFAMSGRMEIVVSHSKRKERVLNGAPFIEREPKVKRHERATCPLAHLPIHIVLDINWRTMIKTTAIQIRKGGLRIENFNDMRLLSDCCLK